MPGLTLDQVYDPVGVGHSLLYQLFLRMPDCFGTSHFIRICQVVCFIDVSHFFAKTRE
jgi:hypothetical protein